MNNERTVIIQNTGDCPIGLKDTQGRMYRLGKQAKMRISSATLLDILDFPGSRKIFNLGYVSIGNITPEELYSMGLTEEEIDKFLDKTTIPAIVIAEKLDAEEETIIVVEEPKKEIVEDKPVVKPVVKQPTTTKKSTNKKSTKKTASKK